MIIAVDFDKTLSFGRFPRCGPANVELIEALIKAQQCRHKVILWTTRTGKALDAAVLWLHEQGIEPDAINKNLRSYRGRVSDKIAAGLYIDDKACRPDEAIERIAKLPLVLGRPVSRRRAW